jgi:hypothetical protein
LVFNLRLHSEEPAPTRLSYCAVKQQQEEEEGGEELVNKYTYIIITEEYPWYI